MPKKRHRPFELWETPCDTQIQLGIEERFVYEITQTFNPTLYTHASAWEAIPQFNKTLCEWLEVEEVSHITVVIEYTKARMPHLHCAISCKESLDVSFRANIIKGLQRLYGRCTFKSAINMGAYETYMSKDIEANFMKHQIRHFAVFI